MVLTNISITFPTVAAARPGNTWPTASRAKPHLFFNMISSKRQTFPTLEHQEVLLFGEAVSEDWITKSKETQEKEEAS